MNTWFAVCPDVDWQLALALLLALQALVLLAALPRPFRLPPPLPRDAPRVGLPRVSVIVPARDEIRNLPRLLESLSALDHADFEVIVVDGGSTDGSRDVAAAWAARDPRFRLVDEPPLPHGWVGKPWACWNGRAAATGAWLLFTDADTVHAPDSLRRAQHHARARGVGFLTAFTMQRFGTFWERVIMPPVFTLIYAAVRGPGEERLADPEHAIANGQYMLFDTETYDALGGHAHARVRGSIVEDLALAREMARAQVPATFADATGAVETRMYDGLRAMFGGWRKNVATGARHTPAWAYVLTILTFATGLLAAPLALLATDWRAGMVAALVAGAATVRVRVAQRGSRGAHWGHALLHPWGYAFFAMVLIASAWDRATGKGPLWKGRRYAPR